MNLAEKRWLPGIAAALLLAWCAGMLGRGFWTPDEPREADIAWRMSWQADKSVPLLAGNPFCEKPPFTYWAAALPISAIGMQPWIARLPNFFYAALTALSVGLLARRLSGTRAGLVAAAAVSTFLLGYQVAIWFATDAPLLAFVSLSLLGLQQGFYATESGSRLRGYTLMHTALALGFLSKSAFGWFVPALTLASLMVWERRWRELLRWELYAGLAVQALLILSWIWTVYAGPDGLAHLKIFFWNNLAGRLTHVEAPVELQYASAHRNFPGKYFLELPLYLWPWTLLVLAAVRHTWQQRGWSQESQRAVRFALASSIPCLLLLSFAATARNVYLAPVTPGFALLLGSWACGERLAGDPWDRRALRGSAVLLVVAALLAAAAVLILVLDADTALSSHTAALALGATGIVVSLCCALDAWRSAARGPSGPALGALFGALCALLIGPSWFAYGQIDRWQNLANLGAQIKADVAGHPLILLAPDETTRALVDLYVSTQVALVPDQNIAGRLAQLTVRTPQARVLVQIEGRSFSPLIAKLNGSFKRRTAGENRTWNPGWLADVHLRLSRRYELPNGRRYALLDPQA